MLTEQRRTQLDVIVQKMMSNKESDNNIQFVVDDFKKKYENETQAPNVNVEPAKSGNFLGNIAKDIYKGLATPIVNMIARPGQLVQGVLNPTSEDLSGDIPIGFGTTAHVTDPFADARNKGVLKTLQSNVGQAAQTVATGLGAVRGGALFGAGMAQEANKGILPTLVDAGIGAASGKLGEAGFKLTGGVLKSAGGFMKELGKGSKVFQEAAQKNIADILNPTTKLMKSLTQKVSPELAKRKIISFSRKDLLSTVGKKLEESAVKLESAYNALPKETKVTVAPIVKKITDQQNKLVINDLVPAAQKSLYKMLGNLKSELLTIAGDENAPIGTIRKYRQSLDAVIDEAGKGFGYDSKGKAVLKAQTTMANTIREELSKQFPDIAKINNEFTLWKRTSDILKATIERKTGQATPLGQKIATGAGIAAGLTRGGIPGAIEGGLAMKYLQKAANSTLWNSISSASKQNIANALASWDENIAAKGVRAALKASGVLLNEAGEFIGGVPKVLKEAPRKEITSVLPKNAGLSIYDVSKMMKYKVDGKIIYKDLLDVAGFENSWKRSGKSFERLGKVNVKKIPKSKK